MNHFTQFLRKKVCSIIVIDTQIAFEKYLSNKTLAFQTNVLQLLLNPLMLHADVINKLQDLTLMAFMYIVTKVTKKNYERHCLIHQDCIYNGSKVVNSREVREVQEGATCSCAKKISKLG